MNSNIVSVLLGGDATSLLSPSSLYQGFAAWEPEPVGPDVEAKESVEGAEVGG